MKRWECKKRRPRRRAPSGDRSAFTLIELLVTISIIATLGAISITTVRSSIETARRSQTETTIAKIDSVLTSIYERYQYLRLEPIGANGKARAWNRVEMMRDLLRCDLPCVPEELKNVWALDGTPTPLQESYRMAIANAYATNWIDALSVWETGDDPRVCNAELLYLVVTNGDPESRAGFSDRDVADTDGNGLLEFVDGWGRPICWMRWAPGLESSDRQPQIPLGLPFVYDENMDADPFNPLGLSLQAETDGAPATANYPDKGWFLVPYIFSGGREVDDEDPELGWYGLVPPIATSEPFTAAHEYRANDADELIPGAPDGSKTHKDNIDNHTLVR